MTTFPGNPTDEQHAPQRRQRDPMEGVLTRIKSLAGIITVIASLALAWGKISSDIRDQATRLEIFKSQTEEAARSTREWLKGLSDQGKETSKAVSDQARTMAEIAVELRLMREATTKPK